MRIQEDVLLRSSREAMRNSIIVLPGDNSIWFHCQHKRRKKALVAGYRDGSMKNCRSLPNTCSGYRMLIDEQLNAAYDAERGNEQEYHGNYA